MKGNKKRNRDDDLEEEEEFSENENDNGEHFEGRMNMPQKSKYRMRAHCNPLAEITIH